VPQNEKKLWDEQLDADTAPHLVSARRFINGLNIRFGTPDSGYVGLYTNIKGNVKRNNTLPAGTNICIGACADDTDRYAIFFNQNSNSDDGIYLWDTTSSTMYTVAESDDITGGLGFNKYKLINGAFVINGLLHWNDNNKQPRRINLSAFMSAQGSTPVTAAYSITLPIDQSEITLIRKPMAYPPSITKAIDAGFNNNFIANNSYQFAVRLIDFDGSEAVLSGWSRSSRFNLTSETENYIKVKVDVTETIPQTTRLVELIMKDEFTNKGFKIKVWDRLVSTENTLINNQDLSFDFYGNVTGPAVSEADMVRPYYSVPLKAGSIAAGRNRILAADTTEGYDTPTQSSLTLSLPSPVSLGFTSLTKQLHDIRHRNGRGGGEAYAYVGWYVYLTEVLPVGWYAVTSTEQLNTLNGTYPTIGAAPTTVAFSGLAFRGADLQAVAASTSKTGSWRWDGPFDTPTVNNLSITSISTSTYSLMLPQSQHKCGIVFMDEDLRRCGVLFTDDTISIPARNFAFSAGYASIDWTLSNTSAVDEIPDWAYYFAPVKTLNLTTRFLVSAYDEATKYATKDPTTGLFIYTTTTFANNVAAIAIDSSALLRAGLGYELNEGDECILIRNDNVTFNLPVIGQDGQYILLKPANIGTLNTSPSTTVKFVYRIYRPYKVSEQEPFFEMGDLYAINDPGTVNREYSTLQGSFRGDVIALTRNYNATSYYAEAMNPNDNFYKRWYTDAGRANYITKQGQVRKKTGVSFSNVYIPGTQRNGLSSFEALNEEILPAELGVIMKLVMAGKVQAEGEVMLAIGENRTASLYLGEVQIFDQRQNSALAKSSGFIGQVNVLAQEFGTQHPESVAVSGGTVQWVDVKRRAIPRYGGDGLYNTAGFGIQRPFTAFCEKFETLDTAAIEALGGRPFIFGGVDKTNDEYLMTLPATESSPPKGTLSDYDPVRDYPYDIYDGRAKTWAFRMTARRWCAPYGYQAEMFLNVGNKLFALKASELWEQNTTTSYNTFFGEDAGPSRIMFVAKDEREVSKIMSWLTAAVEANVAPSFMHFRSEKPSIQSSHLIASRFSNEQGIYKTAILRDRLSPNMGNADEDLKMLKGRKIRGSWIYVMAEWTTGEQLKLEFINIGHEIGSGHSSV
jgi:hypothetical protein